MDKGSIKSGRDYAQMLMNTIIEGESTLPQSQRMDNRLLEYWFEEIRMFADETWLKYITGKRESYLFDDEEFKKLFEDAGMRYASDILNGLIDKELVQVGVREDGELVYSMTDKGREYVKGEE
jgi:hypothetical protein